jgi:hypothetical protein
MMHREYDIFERFADGSSIWRASVAGRFEAQRKIQEFAEHSGNRFFILDVVAGQYLRFDLSAHDPRPPVRARTVNR